RDRAPCQLRGVGHGGVRHLEPDGEQEPQARRRGGRRPLAGRVDPSAVPRCEGLPGLAGVARQGEGPELGQRLHPGPHARPDHHDPVPEKLNWDGWLGVASSRPFIAGYYHPGEWRKRLDFGTGTFGDMGCHILDPVYASLALTAPKSVRSDGDTPNADSWGL